MNEGAKILLRMAAKACLEVAGVAPLVRVLGEGLVDALPLVRRRLWESWAKLGKAGAERVAALTSVSPSDAMAMAEAVVSEEATDRSPEDREALTRILVQVPGLVQRSLRRPGDPRGLSLSRHLLPRSEIDIGAWLPMRPTRFRTGQSPLPGVDRVLDRILGAGGFGEVWLARNPNRPSSPPVVLKFCLDGASANVLRREAALLDRVERLGAHPGIVRLLKTYLSADVPCLEYEYVEGGELTNVIRGWHGSGNPPSPEAVARVMRDICDPVAHAHGAEPAIVHRDLKPANILVTKAEDGKFGIKIADFGIGGVAAAEAMRAATVAVSLAASQISMARGSGTPLYASAEQMRGEAPDPRDDVYALGVIWHQLLTGDLSFGAPTGTKWMKNLRERGMNEALLDVLVNCFEPRADRVRDARALSGAIREALEPAPPASRSTREEPAARPAAAPKTAAPPAPTPRPQPARSQPSPRRADVEVIEARPDPSVVTDATLREAIEQTGRPWRIRETKTGMEFLLVPPGEYMRGASPGDGEADEDEKPAHRVRITKAFYLGRYEVTQGEWKKATGGSNPSCFKTSDRHPVETVSHTTVTEVARSLGCRLPAEAEWEYAGRAGTTAARYGNLDDVAWHGKNSSSTTHPVGEKRANALGFHDMIGSVWEWCSDWYAADAYESCAGGVADPQGPRRGKYRLLRGGSWFYIPRFCRVSNRNWNAPDLEHVFVGVRLAMDP